MTAYSGSNNQILQYFYPINQRIGINNSNPSYTFDVAGSANFRSNLNVQTYITWLNTYGNATLFSSNNWLGLNTATPQGTFDVGSGSIYASGYCNLLINSFSNSSINNAPTSLALSNVYAQSTFGSNIGVYCSNNVTYNQFYKKITKSVDSSNSIIKNIGWPTASLSNSYILLNVTETVTNGSNFGVRQEYIGVNTSNSSIISSIQTSFGSPSIFGNYFTGLSSSNSSSISLQSFNSNLIGTTSHAFSVEVVNQNLQDVIGSVYLN